MILLNFCYRRFAVIPFTGCIEGIRLEMNFIHLSDAKAIKEVQSSCSDKTIRLVSLISERSFVHFSNSTIAKNIEFMFQFKTKKPIAVLATIVSDEMVFF